MTEGVKLTKAERHYLRVIPDWSAPYEVRNRLGHKMTESGRCTDVVERMLSRLVGKGLAEYGRPNHTYRITDAGRAAIQPQPSDQKGSRE